MYFLSKAFRGLKWGMSVLGLVGSGLVIGYGAVYHMPIYVIGGSITGVPSLFSVMENTKIINDIEKNIKKFKLHLNDLQHDLQNFQRQNLTLKNNITDLQSSVESINETKEKLIEENDKLNSLFKKASENLDSMNQTKEDYETQIDKLRKNLTDLKNNNKLASLENQKLKESVESLIKLKEEYKTKQEKMSEIIVETNSQLDKLRNIKDSYLELSEKFEIIETQNAKLTEAVQNAEKLYQSSKFLIKTLIETNISFKELKENMNTEINSLGTTSLVLHSDVEKLSKLLEFTADKLVAEDFSKMDANKDDKIDRQEFADFIQK